MVPNLGVRAKTMGHNLNNKMNNRMRKQEKNTNSATSDNEPDMDTDGDGEMGRWGGAAVQICRCRHAKDMPHAPPANNKLLYLFFLPVGGAGWTGTADAQLILSGQGFTSVVAVRFSDVLLMCFLPD